jgi:hypothetical protein
MKFFNYFRMSMSAFDFLLRRVERDLDALVYGRKTGLSERVHYNTCATGELFGFLPYHLFRFPVTKPNVISDRFGAATAVS